MALGNTPLKRTDIHLEARKSFAMTVRFRYRNDTPADMDGYSVRMAVSEPQHLGGAVVLLKDAAPIDNDPGVFQFSIQASETDLESGSYPFDATFVSDRGYSTPFLKGAIEIGDNADEDASNVYDTADTLDDVLVVLGTGHEIVVCIVQADARKGDKGDIGPPGGIHVQPDQPAQDDPFEFTPLWVDTDDDLPSVPPEVQVGALKPVEDSVLIWIDTGV